MLALGRVIRNRCSATLNTRTKSVQKEAVMSIEDKKDVVWQKAKAVRGKDPEKATSRLNDPMVLAQIHECRVAQRDGQGSRLRGSLIK